MKVSVQSIHFNADKKLLDFIQKKILKSVFKYNVSDNHKLQLGCEGYHCVKIELNKALTKYNIPRKLYHFIL